MIFPDQEDSTQYLKRSDPDELLGSFSAHPFKLDEREWPTVEHYFQSMKFDGTDADYMTKVQQAESPKKAQKLGRKNSRNLRSDWPKIKRIVMTRALYTKCKAHPEVAKALLASKDKKLLESSQYDYQWGCGRDRRGENLYGQVLMDVRKKLREELLDERLAENT